MRFRRADQGASSPRCTTGSLLGAALPTAGKGLKRVSWALHDELDFWRASWPWRSPRPSSDGACPPGRAEERDRFESLVTPHLVRF
jgi:hypothetical protein